MSQHTYDPQKLLERIHLMMNYDLSMTRSENVSIVSEQINPVSGYRMQIPSMPSDYLGKGGGFERSQYANMPKEKYYDTLNNLPKIEGENVSDLLVKTRDFLFTPLGMTSQVVLSILGAEIGLPLAFGILDIVIFINDLYLMGEEWRESDYKPWSEDWFIFHLQDGPTMNSEYQNGFTRVMEDILLVVTGGIFKLVGMSAKGIYKFVMKKIGNNIGENIAKAGSHITSKKVYLDKLPKKLGNWGKSKIATAEKSLQLLKSPKTATQSVVKNIPKAAVGGALTYGFAVFFEKVVVPLLFGKENEITEMIANKNDDGLIEYIIKNNPQLFPKGIKKFQIVTNSKKKFVKLIIDGQDYDIIDYDKYLLKKM